MGHRSLRRRRIGELRHGPIDTSPANAVFAADAGSTDAGRRGWLVHGSDDAGEKIVCLADRCLSLSRIEGSGASAAPTLLDLVPLERGLIALTAGGHFLCAQRDGSLHFQNSWCSTWECFLASEDWCGAAPAAGEAQSDDAARLAIDRKGIAKFIVDARLRVKANAASKATKILIYGYPAWSHGLL